MSRLMNVSDFRPAVIAIFTLAACALCLGEEPWIPALKAIEPPTLLKKSEVEAKTPEGTVFKPASFKRTISLNGQWKFSGLESSAKAFTPLDAEESKLAGVAFDDSKWGEIAVPLNWWLNPSSSYVKTLKFGAVTDVKGGAESVLPLNPYFKGWYRKKIALPDPLPKGRIVADFAAIGYEAELFVNGMPAGRHHGDFVPFEADITKLVQPGENLIALRVLSDFGPGPKESFLRTYGAKWHHTVVKGGIWQSASLRIEPVLYIEGLRLTPDLAAGELQFDATVVCDEDSKKATPGLAYVSALPGDGPAPAIEKPELVLRKGVNHLSFRMKAPNPKLWSTDSPNLYFGVLYFKAGNEVESAKIERFGFRDFKVAGTRLALNGKETYLFFESAHSVFYGGHNTPDGNSKRPAEILKNFRQRGYNMLRTAHMPISTEFLDLADELGMMIYDEWSFAFIDRIDEPVFEANNLSELERFVLNDYNHPSVVMWSLGNEVPHGKKGTAIGRQLDKQTALVRKLDLQKRPICSFAGIGDFDSYGDGKLDTDVMDLHLYTGITQAWTHWDEVFDSHWKNCAAVYGDGKSISMPLIISECVGGGWGMRPSANFKLDDIDAYLKIIKEPYTFGSPGAAGYSGVIGVAAAMDPARNYLYLQNLLGSRIGERIRQDMRVAGFAPWFAVSNMAQASRWTQPVYPGLRDRKGGKLMPRQLLAPVTLKLEAFVVNQGIETAMRPRLVIELASKETRRLAELEFQPIQPFTETSGQIELNLPELRKGEEAGEIRLTLYDGAEEIGRNGYAVTFRSMGEATKPIGGAAQAALLARNPGFEAILKELGIPFSFVDTKAELERFKLAVLPPETKLAGVSEKELRTWVEAGGRLHVVEPLPGLVPAFPEYRTVGDANCFVEIATPSHPVFRGLVQTDFDVWAENKNGNVLKFALVPLGASALAVKGGFLVLPYMGAGVTEAAVEKGRVFISTLDASNLWRKNGAATFFLRRALEYLTAPQNGLYAARALERNATSDAPFILPEGLAMPLVLGEITKSVSPEVLAMFERGKTVKGVPFRIEAQKTIASGTEWVEANVSGKIASVYFLHDKAWGESAAKGNACRAIYDDGSVRAVSPNGNATSCDALEPKIELTVKGANGENVELYVSQWNNPCPDKKLQRLEFAAPKVAEGAPLLLAASAETGPSKALTILNANDKAQHWTSGSFPSGPRPSVSTKEGLNNPAGPCAGELKLPATGETSMPFAFLHYEAKGDDISKRSVLSFLVKSEGPGMIDIILPESTWKSWLSASLSLDGAKGEWIRVRLNLKRDFKLVGRDFPSSAMRPEIGIFNGRDRSAGFPRGQANFLIADIRFE